MLADILGTSWDQCWSMVQYSFTPMETRRLISVMLWNWCCSFIMCSYKTMFWLPSFCLVLWRWGWPINEWNVFLLPLVRLHTTTWWQRWDPNPHLRRDWCSSLAYSAKKDGSLCICIDPQKLNQALKRCPHKVPTLEELNPQFPGSTVLMDRAKETGLVFNSDKCTIRQPEISFFGNIYSKDGIRPDLAKVHDLQNMPVPQDKEDLQRFLGMITYLATFIPNFSEESQRLRDLLKKNIPFEMSEDHLHCFQKLKTAISAKSCVKYFDPTKPTTLEVDSSTKGLRAAILQDGQPVAFASKALNSAQSNYPNTDREMLAVVFGINRFHRYLYGRPFRVITDHKPLEMISKKPLLRAHPGSRGCSRKYRDMSSPSSIDKERRWPWQTLCRGCRIQRTRVQLSWISGLMVLRLRWQKFIVVTQTWSTFHTGNSINFETRQPEIRPWMRSWKPSSKDGLSDSIKDLPTDVWVFWSFCDELAVEDGIIFKGKQVLIPESLRANILAQLHQSHQGIEKPV